MSRYDATATCRNLACTVITYAYDQSGASEVPECPACLLRQIVARNQIPANTNERCWCDRSAYRPHPQTEEHGHTTPATLPPAGWRNRGENA